MSSSEVEYRRGEYRKSAARREQIVEAAFAVFSELGYTAGSVSEIARRVGMTQTGVLHHFKGGKTALLQAVLDRRDEQAQAILADKRGIELLRSLPRITESQLDKRGMIQAYRMLSTEAVNPDHPAHAHFRERQQMVARGIEQAFREAVEDGDAAADLDPRAAALSALAMTEGLEVMWLNGFDVDMVEGSRRHIQQFLTTEL
ncbi:TetR/AcrR family transcriptional regulator [Microbacterium karelineae]|uniref:TetR/AcrR family transcriptional regulator n=1 Tax=Microbacterium karelineae TaxID=2654283 RepID=UPI0018D3BA3D|nr:TetR/AcrR family transcriptional regulator [Microbacterium karelineae]